MQQQHHLLDANGATETDFIFILKWKGGLIG